MTGQRGTAAETAPRRTKPPVPEVAVTKFAVFPTDLGWFALAGFDGRIAALTIGHASEGSARRGIAARLGEKVVAVSDWSPVLRRRLQRYAQGEPQDFHDVDLLLPALTGFQRAVVAATRSIPYGRTRTYAELAELAGYPRAARAVGNVMAANRFPVLVPCHRVVAAGGKWGGFSAPQGVDLKRRMLALESERTAAGTPGRLVRPPAL